MRLHRLSVTAFGPFAGSEQVDFDALSADGLFLLHGRTGAGKTSVLDAVCFALYGAVPGARSGGAPDLRSHHAAPELAPVVELELTAGGRRLRVERSPAWTRPKRRGEGTTTEQARTLLAEWSPGAPDAGPEGWRPLSSRNDEASQVLTDVLGMALPQFATVVLLPQGEFATFLRSGVTERRALLQRLFSTDRYERAERWLAAERARTAAAHDAAAARLAALADRAEHAAAEWAPDAGAAPDDDAAARGGQALPAAQDLLERVRGLALAAQRAALSSEAERVGAATAARAAAAREHALRASADRARRAAQVREQRHRLEQAVPAVARQRRELEAALAAQGLEGHLRALAAATDGVAEAERRAAGAAAELAAAAGPDGPAGTDGSAAPEDRSSPEQLRESAARHRQEQGRLAELVQLEAETAQRERQAREVAAEHDRLAREQTRLRERSQRSAQARAELAQRAESAAAGAAAAPETAAALARAQDLLAHATTADALTARCEPARRAALEADRTALEARSRWLDARQARWEGVAAELAARLESGAPCPVCGSCEHPAPADGGRGPAPAPPDVQGQPVQPVQPVQPAAAAVAAEDAAQAAFERADAAARAAQQQLSDLERDAAAARGRAGGTSAQDAAQLLEQARLAASRASAAQADLDAARAELAALQAQESADAAALQDVSSALARLAERAEQLAGALDRDRARLEAAGGQEGLAARSARLAALARAAEALAAAGEAEASARDTARDTEDAAVAAASTAGFADLAAARAALRSSAQRAELQGAVAAHERATAALEAQLAELARPDRTSAPGAERLDDSDELDDQDDPDDPDAPDRALAALAEAAQQRAAADEAAEAAVRAAERAATAAAQLERLEVETARGAAALEPLARRAEVAGDLARCAEGTGGGNARRMKLSTYVLAARLEQVAAAASERLEVMSDGRYRLVHTDALERRGAGSGLGLRVLDAWTGVERDVATLSGGETFMASLALALGLADVVRAEGGGAPVETLFVDEGFGTLDPESLEEVMGVLEQLRAGGRAVGLVSHVPELRTRVPARLEVLRTSTGSRLATVLA
ncbi:AAA family ATPase [Streptomyces sp. NP160]|uniref:AAA family ATPase n=1 Tax=Streptomyces sp. NP160 TaxID=2586637 RepID=UPI0015D5F675|nr:AAA family ATPase [Streptomyces sp. NP160]